MRFNIIGIGDKRIPVKISLTVRQSSCPWEWVARDISFTRVVCIKDIVVPSDKKRGKRGILYTFI
jgi:hypothetical protein